MASKAIQALIEISKDMEMIDSEEPIAFMFNINKCKEILESRSLSWRTNRSRCNKI
ncbi:hypothetical protein D3C75_1315080 [compost metagenome]